LGATIFGCALRFGAKLRGDCALVRFDEAAAVISEKTLGDAKTDVGADDTEARRESGEEEEEEEEADDAKDDEEEDEKYLVEKELPDGTASSDRGDIMDTRAVAAHKGDDVWSDDPLPGDGRRGKGEE
jgi:hypothetical protein